MLLTSMLASSWARADVPPPVGTPPGTGGSPGTGGMPGLPPIPPPGTIQPGQPPATTPGSQNLPPIPPPDNRPSNPEYPDPSVNNYPPDPWYGDMYNDIYYTNYYFWLVEYWAYNEYYNTGYPEAYDVYIFAGYIRTAMTEYYWSLYDQYGHPRSFSWGRVTRGDFNYGFEWWIKPLYYQFLQYAYNYYYKYSNYSGFDYAGYHDHVYKAGRQYHDFCRCNFAKDGSDPKGKDDTQAFPLEKAAGFDVTQ
jgi:hypothetical protein